MLEISKGSRLILPSAQRVFLVKAINFSWYLTDQVKKKHLFFRGRVPLVSSTIILAEILHKSEFGDHPLAGEKYPVKTGKWANNLTLMPTDNLWGGKAVTYDGKDYKSFKTWEEFGVHFTDGLACHQGKINKYLLSNLPTSAYNSFIENFELGEFEFNGEERREV